MSEGVASARSLVEIRATAHLMVLEPGLFCVFNKPGAAPPDPATGLPGVRLSPAPAPGPFSGSITLSGFSADGWLSSRDDAALLRVSGGPAQVLVTVYQAVDSLHEAPQLQVLRLSEAPRFSSPAPPTLIEAMAHIYGQGDVAGRFGEWLGERGSRRWIEGFALQPQRQVLPSDIEYQAVLGRDWLSPWSEAGQFCGSRGMSLPILGLRVRLRGASTQAASVSLEATFVDGTAVGPVTDGGACEAASLAALEAFRVTLQPKAPAPSAVPGRAAGKRKR